MLQFLYFAAFFRKPIKGFNPRKPLGYATGGTSHEPG